MINPLSLLTSILQIKRLVEIQQIKREIFEQLKPLLIEVEKAYYDLAKVTSVILLMPLFIDYNQFKNYAPRLLKNIKRLLINSIQVS